MDRLSAMARKKSMLTIPVLNVQKQLDDDYRDQIELFSCRVADLEDTNKVLQDINDRLKQRDNDSQVRITSYQAAVNERSFAVARVTSLESDVRKLNADLKTETSNRDHFRTLVVQQDAFIKEAKRQIEEFKSKKDAELKSKTSEAEHLAKQALRLNEENSKLRADSVELTSRSNQLNTQTPLLMEENQKFREQTARLIEEKRKLEDQVNQYECYGCRSGQTGEYCGGCLGCLMRQAEHNMNETDKELRVEMSIASYKDSIIETLTKTLKTVKELPCIRWRTQARVYKDCLNTVAALQGNIDNIREHKIVPRGAA
jgi:DNA repair exonuclease SbcCD ATPase subunit